MYFSKNFLSIWGGTKKEKTLSFVLGLKKNSQFMSVA